MSGGFLRPIPGNREKDAICKIWLQGAMFENGSGFVQKVELCTQIYSGLGPARVDHRKSSSASPPQDHAGRKNSYFLIQPLR